MVGLQFFKHSISINPDNSNRKTINGYIGFFCTKCFYPIIRKVNNFQVNYLLDDDIDIETKFKFKCPNCEHLNEWTEYLDPNITSPLSTLNIRGYPTYCSCEGHPENWSDAYILFKDDTLKRKNCKGLKYWEYDKNSYYVTYDKDDDRQIYHNATCLRCSIEVPLEKRIESLTRWLITLDFAKNR